MLDCTEGGSGPLSQTKPESRQTSGTSALTFQGTPGVWSRELDTYPDTGTCTNDAGRKVACEGFTAKDYMISLLVGNAIQTVTYYTTVDGITRHAARPGRRQCGGGAAGAAMGDHQRRLSTGGTGVAVA